MMSILRRFFRTERATSESDTASDEKLPLFEDSEKAKHVLGYILSPTPKSWIKHRKLPFAIKLLFLIFAFTFTLFSGQSIINYATLGYNALLRSSKAHDHVVCGQEVSLDEPIMVAAPPITAPPVGAKLLDRTGWESNCSSSKDQAHNCSFAIVSKGANSYWQSESVSTGARHWIMINLKKRYNLHSLAMTPSQDWADGGSVRKHRVEVFTENGNWELVALGAWQDDGRDDKHATFEPRLGQFVRLTVIDSTLNQNFVAIRDINIYAVDMIPSSVRNGGRWSYTLDFPLVPVTAFLNPKNLNLITLAADMRNKFNLPSKVTISATWDPQNEIIEEKVIDTTEHDMFCPGTSFDESGRVIFTGGASPSKFSIYDPALHEWSTPVNETTHLEQTLKIARGYQGQTFLPNGKTFMIGGNWSGGRDLGPRDGELYDPTTKAWKILQNVKAEFIRMDVSQSCGKTRNDDGCNVYDWREHHPWLFAWKKDSIFHAGPSKKMNWIFTTPPDGSVKDGGFRREDKIGGLVDGDAVSGITSMYDAENGIILTAGGAPNYHYWFDPKTKRPNDHRQEATANTFEIKLGEVEPGTVVIPKKVAPMSRKRIFANAVILPNGETFVVGGQSQGEPYYHETWQPVPEIYSPETKTWRDVARHSTPRVYHSWALLLPDATVLVGGGGLNEGFPLTNHFDAQIYQPAYLFTPDGKTAVAQPKILTPPPNDKNVYKVGDKIIITTDVEVDAASLIRYSATTHSLNNDLRRIKLTIVKEGNASDRRYSVIIPKDEGVTLPGYWMLFVLRNGVPSHAATVQISAK